MGEHVITRAEPTHRHWDATLAPVLEVEPGDVVVADTEDFAGGQIGRKSTAADLLELDFDAIYPLAGPIAVRGARPGDALAVEILGFELPSGGGPASSPASACSRARSSRSPSCGSSTSPAATRRRSPTA